MKTIISFLFVAVFAASLGMPTTAFAERTGPTDGSDFKKQSAEELKKDLALKKEKAALKSTGDSSSERTSAAPGKKKK